MRSVAASVRAAAVSERSASSRSFSSARSRHSVSSSPTRRSMRSVAASVRASAASERSANSASLSSARSRISRSLSAIRSAPRASSDSSCCRMVASSSRTARVSSLASVSAPWRATRAPSRVSSWSARKPSTVSRSAEAAAGSDSPCSASASRAVSWRLAALRCASD